MIKLRSIVYVCLFAVISLNAQIIKDAVPGDFTPATPAKYTEGITNPGPHIQDTVLPLDAEVRLDNGETVKLGKLFDGEKTRTFMCSLLHMPLNLRTLKE